MMRRAAIVGEQAPLLIDEAPIPDTPPKGIVIKTKFSGVCHSDLNQWFNVIDTGFEKRKFTANPNYQFPIVPGHEIGGVVQSIGSQCNQDELDFKIGDEVVLFPWIGCGNCLFCYNDQMGLCNRRDHGLGIGTPGGYATHCAVRDTRFVFKIPPNLPLELACMLPCSGLTTYNAVTTLHPSVVKTNTLKGSCSVLIIGAGGLALWCLLIALTMWPKTTKIVVADISEVGLKIAKERGCHDTVLWPRNSDDQAAVIADTKSKAIDGGFDGVIDVVNNPATAERAFKVTHRGSHLVLVGLFGGAAKYPLIDFVHGLRTVQGVLTGNVKLMADLIKFVSENQLEPPPINFLKLDEVYEYYLKMKEGKVRGRSIIKFD